MRSVINTINISRVLRTIWLVKRISRTEIAQKLHLDKSTVTKIVANLDEAGIIETVASGEAGPLGGRRPVYLTIRKRFGCILGLEIRPGGYASTIIDLHGDVLERFVSPLAFDGRGIVELFFEILERERCRVASVGLPLIGIGVGLSGMVNPRDGIIRQSNPLRIMQPVRFLEEVSQSLSLPVKVDNDANCCCWGELAFSNEVRPENFLIILGEFRPSNVEDSGDPYLAVGFGIVIGENVHYGSDFSAGEFKSINWRPSNGTQFATPVEELRRLERTPEVRTRVFRELAAHVAYLVSVFGFSSVVVAGELQKYRSELLPILRDEIERSWCYPDQVNCTLRTSSLGEIAVAYGAAAMFLEHLFSLPQVRESGAQASSAGVALLQRIQEVRSEAVGERA